MGAARAETCEPHQNRRSYCMRHHMTDLSAFPITRKWPATHPDRIQLYSLPTPNGVKVSIMLEETGLAYEPHLVRFDAHDQLTPEFLSISPNNKIPAILDPNGPGGKPLPLFESGAILIYLAEKSGRLLPRRRGRPLHRDPVADVPDGRDRADVRPDRLLPQIRRQGLRGQAAARPLRRRGEAAAGGGRASASARAPGSAATTIRSPTSPPSRGSTT